MAVMISSSAVRVGCQVRRAHDRSRDDLAEAVARRCRRRRRDVRGHGPDLTVSRIRRAILMQRWPVGTLVHHVDVGAGDDIDLVVRADVEVDRVLAERLTKRRLLLVFGEGGAIAGLDQRLAASSTSVSSPSGTVKNASSWLCQSLWLDHPQRGKVIKSRPKSVSPPHRRAAVACGHHRACREAPSSRRLYFISGWKIEKSDFTHRNFEGERCCTYERLLQVRTRHPSPPNATPSNARPWHPVPDLDPPSPGRTNGDESQGIFSPTAGVSARAATAALRCEVAKNEPSNTSAKPSTMPGVSASSSSSTPSTSATSGLT
jgi:hypothetical protein